ncbi:MAG: hypothetical protein DRH43_00800 [Deltaproteobacteria bacterium]|nr:MAG: hypothetical protein DRH43_00800 [Deltaproteobacteria bacterium]
MVSTYEHLAALLSSSKNLSRYKGIKEAGSAEAMNLLNDGKQEMENSENPEEKHAGFGRKRPGGFLTLKGMAQNGESARVCGGV